jgi:pyrroline-5-carboxylate reductase
MSAHSFPGDVVLVGCGRLGSAILEGWLATDAVDPARLLILTPSSKPAAEAARAKGARINADPGGVSGPAAVVLAVKPAVWREAIRPLTASSEAAVVVSVMAGVRAADLSAALPGRAVVRVMPTTAVAQARGVAALWSDDDGARATARALFARLADVVGLDHEALIDAATATAGSAPAFVYAFTRALAEAGASEGLPPEAARRLARGALRSAGAGADTDEPLDALIARIASPGGTTRAGLDAMAASGDLERAAQAAVKAAVARAKALSGS